MTVHGQENGLILTHAFNWLSYETTSLQISWQHNAFREQAGIIIKPFSLCRLTFMLADNKEVIGTQETACSFVVESGRNMFFF